MGKVKTVHIPQGGVLIEIKDICKTYAIGDEVVHVDDHLNPTIRIGEPVVIVGKSGSSKSTLMNTIDALDVPTSSTYLLGDEDVDDMTQNELVDIRNRMIGFIFQQYNLLPRLNLPENVELPLLCAHIPSGERKEHALRQLERVGLKEETRNMPNQLSDGQQQRVSIARALAGNSSLLLADEPIGALDPEASRQIFNFFQGLHKEGNVVIMITHDDSIAVRAKRIVWIQDGKVNFDGKAERYVAIIQAHVKEHLEQ